MFLLKSVVNNRDLKPSSLNHNTETSKITKASNRNTKKWSLSRFHSQQTLITDAVTMQVMLRVPVQIINYVYSSD